MLRATTLLVFCIFGFASYGSSFHAPYRPAPDIQSLLDLYTYDVPFAIKSQEQDNSKRKDCWKWDITYEVDYPQNPNPPLLVTARVYTPNPKRLGGQKSPFVVMLPPVSGINLLDKNMGNEFCDRAMTALIITNDFTGFDGKALPPIEDHMHAFQRAVAAVRGAKAFAEQSPEVDEDRMALFGVSLGGILGTMTYSVFPHLRAGYFLVSGSDLPYIMARSEQSLVTRVRKLRMAQENLQTVDEYEAYLRTFFDHDLSDVAHLVPTESVRMIISRNDKDVPTRKQFELQRALGVPETRYSDKGHARTVINNMLWKRNRRKIAQFLEDRLQLPNPRQPTVAIQEPTRDHSRQDSL